MEFTLWMSGTSACPENSPSYAELVTAGNEPEEMNKVGSQTNMETVGLLPQTKTQLLCLTLKTLADYAKISYS